MSGLKTYHLLLLSLLGGLFLSFSWFPAGFFPVIFIAFVPLLLIEHSLFVQPQKYKTLTLFFCCYLTFIIWNVVVTWWVKNASLDGAAMAFLANSLLMTFVFMMFHRVKRRLGEQWGHVIFICFWLTFEFLHLDWDLTWPWLTLGNVFAAAPFAVQWYEYTGVFGGSLWILVVNVLIFELIRNFSGAAKREKLRGISIIAAVLVLPFLLSVLVSSMYEEKKGKEQNVVVVQPNIDPYNEKFSGDYLAQLKKMLELAFQKTDHQTDYLLFPETALTEDIWENNLENSQSIRLLQEVIRQYPKLKIIVGASTYRSFQPWEQPSATARMFTDSEGFYDAFNTALQLDSTGRIQVYHKSKLVPGVEKMPFPAFFKYFENFAISLGGISGSLGMQEERTPFIASDSTATAPVVCYESIYGEYVGEYISNGAQFISIITNDGWWGDTPGYKQHLKYGALRAIETRLWIARSANTGVSCFIDPKGNILQPSAYWTPAVLSQTIRLHKEQTFYTKHGDYIARAAFYISIALLFYSLLIRFRIAKKW
jgi:apolipoprotein N-acyltransferase